MHIHTFSYVSRFFWLFGSLTPCVHGEVLALLVSLLCARLGLLRCASCWTRPLGGGRWRHYLCNLQGDYLEIHKTAFQRFGIYYVGLILREPKMLALAGQPSLHGYDGSMVYWT